MSSLKKFSIRKFKIPVYISYRMYQLFIDYDYLNYHSHTYLVINILF